MGKTYKVLFIYLVHLLIGNIVRGQVTNKIDVSGNVGIGILTPTQPLEVEKNQDGATFILVRNSTSNTSAFSGVRAISQNQNIADGNIGWILTGVPRFSFISRFPIRKCFQWVEYYFERWFGKCWL
jgi:hypothetical protein